MRFALRSRVEIVWIAAVALTMHAGCGAHRQEPPDTARSYWPAEAKRATVPDDVIRLRLRTERTEDIGILRDHSGSYLCALPCTVLVPPYSGWRVEIGTHNGKLRTVDIPDSLDDVPLGGTASAIVQPKRGHPGAAASLIVSGIALVVLGSLSVAAGAKDQTGTGTSLFTVYGAAMTGVGLPMVIGGAIWSAFSMAPSLDIR